MSEINIGGRVEITSGPFEGMVGTVAGFCEAILSGELLYSIAPDDKPDSRRYATLDQVRVLS